MTVRKLLNDAADRLEELLDNATPGPWTVTGKSGRYGGLVSENSPNTSDDDREGYDGELVAESLTVPNRALIAAMRGFAPHVVALLREESADWDEDEPADSVLPGAFPDVDIARDIIGVDPAAEVSR